ncbi:MAG TPA: hypothetical protein VG735_02585 [Caulobacterales bacterium]|nr:hypothetical protein [Caulobacterales bacterium]
MVMGNNNVFEVDPGILMMARLSIAATFGVATYYVFSPPLRALTAKIKGGKRR